MDKWPGVTAGGEYKGESAVVNALYSVVCDLSELVVELEVRVVISVDVVVFVVVFAVAAFVVDVVRAVIVGRLVVVCVGGAVVSGIVLQADLTYTIFLTHTCIVSFCRYKNLLVRRALIMIVKVEFETTGTETFLHFSTLVELNLPNTFRPPTANFKITESVYVPFRSPQNWNFKQ